MSEIWIWLVRVPPQTLFHHAARKREGDCSGLAAMLDKIHSSFLQMLRSQVAYRIWMLDWTLTQLEYNRIMIPSNGSAVSHLVTNLRKIFLMFRVIKTQSLKENRNILWTGWIWKILITSLRWWLKDENQLKISLKRATKATINPLFRPRDTQEAAVSYPLALTLTSRVFLCAPNEELASNTHTHTIWM